MVGIYHPAWNNFPRNCASLSLSETGIAYINISQFDFKLFHLQRILIAIALIEQGSKAVGQMFSSLFFPIIPFLLQLVRHLEKTIA